ncbi:MAG: DUF2796 domain-containing protein [Rhodobacteraceae bacterium]|nr:DUF2796 domain-containing protein [Paracoccaceae bacterium]
MKRIAFLLSTLPFSLAAEETRSLAAHEHGSGSLGIAVSGNDIAMSFVAPGADIVGFEHEASSSEDRAAIKAAVSDLADPLKLFVFPESALCSVVGVDIAILDEEETHDHDDHADHDDHDEHHDEHADHQEEAGHDDHDHASHESHDDHDDHADHDDHEEHHDEHADHDDHDEHHDEQAEAAHNEYKAEYEISCSNPGAIDRIGFAYFNRFPNARELAVQVVSDKGANAYDVERDDPVLELKGLF